jgi:hypothetical protein
VGGSHGVPRSGLPTFEPCPFCPLKMTGFGCFRDDAYSIPIISDELSLRLVARPYYFFMVIVIRYETTATARWTLLFVVGTLFNYAFTVALWTSFHRRASFNSTTIPQRERATARSKQHKIKSSDRLIKRAEDFIEQGAGKWKLIK